MRNTRRRVLAGISTATATALVLAACGDGGGDEVDAEELLEDESQNVGAMEDFSVGDTFVATTDEPLEISVMYRDHPNYPLDEDWMFFDVIEENHNVVFNNQVVPLSDWAEGRSLAIAGGNAPDVIPVTYAGDEAQFVGSGTILPISDYLDLMPHFTQKADEWDLWEEIEQQRQVDGRYYMIPGLHENPFPQYSLVVRKDLFEESGFTEDPETFDELADQLETVMNDHDLDYGWTERWSGGGPMEATVSFMADSFGTSAGWGFGDGLNYDHDAGQYVYAGAQDGYRDLLTYLNDLVERGVLDPESVSQDDDTAIAKFTNGQAAAIAGNNQEILNYRDGFDDPDVELRMIPVPAGPAGNVTTEGRTESGLMFSADLADKETLVATLQLVDWLYFSDEGQEFAKWGVEGETFERDGDTRILNENIDIHGINPDADESLNVDYGFHNGVWMPAQGSTEDLVQSMLGDEMVEFLSIMGEKEVIPPGPPYPYDEAEQETQSLTSNTLGDAVQQNTAAFIIGQRSLDEWDSYVAELEGLGMENYVQVANEAVERDVDEDAFEDEE
ncbi:extracellular solute-binding protein [Pseudactinotalea sp. Z1748]|uniref:ABC transporter substrate-binding protein n=1 Tax=Pseudactinotalea sp. Z1748 TaxID=3413027 RepID=UPI003C7E0267